MCCQEKTLDRRDVFGYDTAMDSIFEKTLRYDFYGDLLTDRQKEIYEDVVFNDMSLSEAAEQNGISRQGVSDMISRSDKDMEEYEEKLHCIRQYKAVQLELDRLRKAVNGTDLSEQKKETILSFADSIGNSMRDSDGI